MATKLTAKLARELDDATAAVTRLRKDLADAEKARDRVRDRCRPALEPGVEMTAGGVLVKRTVSHPETFSLADYKKAGNKVTAVMRKFVKRGDREDWTVKRA